MDLLAQDPCREQLTANRRQSVRASCACCACCCLRATPRVLSKNCAHLASKVAQLLEIVVRQLDVGAGANLTSSSFRVDGANVLGTIYAISSLDIGAIMSL